MMLGIFSEVIYNLPDLFVCPLFTPYFPTPPLCVKTIHQDSEMLLVVEGHVMPLPLSYLQAMAGEEGGDTGGSKNRFEVVTLPNLIINL